MDRKDKIGKKFRIEEVTTTEIKHHMELEQEDWIVMVEEYLRKRLQILEKYKFGYNLEEHSGRLYVCFKKEETVTSTSDMTMER